MATIEYIGAGHKSRNIGDVAVFKATRKILSEHLVLEFGLLNNARVGVIGGGTILPRVVRPDVVPFEEREINISIGTGVMNPRFYNRWLGPLDIRYYAGKAGISLHQLELKRTFIEAGLIASFENTVPGLNLTDHYLLKKDFQSVSDTEFDILGVRGPVSKEILSKYDIDSEVVGDPALFLEPTGHSTIEDRIAISLQTPNAEGWGSSFDAYTAVRRFCRSQNNRFEFVFVPLNPNDIPINRRLACELNNARLIDYCTIPDVDGVLEEFEKSEIVIGERLHANILSAAVHTPFLSIEYKPKHRDFTKSIKCSNWNIRRDKLDANMINDHMDRVRGNNGQLQDLKNTVSKKRRQMSKISDRVDKIIA